MNVHEQPAALDAALAGKNVLAVLPIGRKDLGKYLVGLLKEGKTRWGWRVSVLCPNVDTKPFEALTSPEGETILPPHFLKAADWEKNEQAVEAVDEQLREGEAVTGMTAGRIVLAAAHSIGRAFSVPFLYFNRYPLVLGVIKNNREPLNIVRRFFRFADDLLDRTKPDFIFFFHWVTPLNMMVWFAARRRGIPCIALRPSKIRSGFAFWTTDRLLLNVDAIERAKAKQTSNAPVSEAATQKIDGFRNQPSMVGYIASKWQNKMRRGFLRWHLEYVRIIIPEMINSFRGQDRSSRESGFARIWRYYRTLFLSYYHQHVFKSYEDAELAKIKYVYFPMHKEAEFAQTFQATLWHDQRNTLRVLASILPHGYKLFMREHRMNYGRRKTDSYRELAELPNAVLIDPFDSQFKYLRNADLVVTENGSSGWEAQLMRRPVLLLSERTFYEGSGLGVTVTDPDRMNEALLEAMSSPPPAGNEGGYDDRIARMIDAEFETTFPMKSEGNAQSLDMLVKKLGPLLSPHSASGAVVAPVAKAS